MSEVFTGNAIEIRLPDYFDEKKQRHELRVTTWPHYIHKVIVGNDLIEVMGVDLQQGMILDIVGQNAPVVEIDKELLYHGLCITPILIGYPETKPVTRKEFERFTFEDGRIEWKIIKEYQNTEKFNKSKDSNNSEGPTEIA